MTWRIGSGRVRPGIAVCAVGGAAVWAFARLTGPLEVPLQVADRSWADDPIGSGQVAERGALDTTVLIGVQDAPSWLRLVTGAHPLLTLAGCSHPWWTRRYAGSSWTAWTRWAP